MTSHRVDLIVALKVPDNEARSALEALRAKMGLADVVQDLARDDVWELSIESADRSAAEALVRELVTSTNLFANPNKHRTSVGPAGAAGTQLARDEVAVLVAERESGEGDAIVATLRGLGVKGVAAARRWTRWRVRMTEPPSENERGLEELVRHIAVTSSRSEGLLSNPHCEVSRAVFPWGGEVWLEE
jgi:phosphoribosylformylglycinamidine (FGAM) synthase PurS component